MSLNAQDIFWHIGNPPLAKSLCVEAKVTEKTAYAVVASWLVGRLTACAGIEALSQGELWKPSGFRQPTDGFLASIRNLHEQSRRLFGLRVDDRLGILFIPVLLVPLVIVALISES